MFFMARQAAATFAGRDARTRTMSTEAGSTNPIMPHGLPNDGGAAVRLLRPVPRAISRPFSLLVLVAWLGQMYALVRKAYEAPVALAADLAQYGSSAQWKGIYYRGEKIGFSVGQTIARDGGYQLIEDGRLQLNLLGATSAVRLHSEANLDSSFAVRDFLVSLDPGSGPTQIRGTLEGRRLSLTITTRAGERKDERDLPEPPSLPFSFARRLAALGLESGQTHKISVFDPITLSNSEMQMLVEAREVVEAAGRPVPAFRVQTRFAGIIGTSWITDTGEVVREESPMGLMVVRETAERAQALAIPGKVQSDLLQAAAIVPRDAKRIDDSTAVDRLQVRLLGTSGFPPDDLQGAGQTVSRDVFDIRDARTLLPGPLDPEAPNFLRPEPFIESDAPEIRAESAKALEAHRDRDPRARAERLLRHVHALIEKKPTLSLPSALEVLRTRVGDCNEHTTLYVALARAAGIPARIATGLVHLHGAFYYHAWAEVYVISNAGGLWLPVDPTLNQFPADATHLRLARGGLDRQAAILGLVGKAEMTMLELEVRPGSTPVLVGRATAAAQPFEFSLPKRDATGRHCWSSPAR
jgi:transglutaminase-like putative cysteine protease